MREVDLPPRELPVLDLLEMGESVAAIKPRVLWIVGANGRLDLTHGAEHWFITDAAENFEPSRWTITSVTNRFHRMPFDRAILTGILSSV